MASKSFAKAQRAVLDSGLLDTIGNEKGAGLGLDNTAQALLDEVSILITDLEKNLAEKQAVSSGKLSSTAEQVVSNDGGELKISILLEEYYKFIDQGVNGTSVSKGSKYSFKNAYVSRSFIENIRKWLIRANLSAKNVKEAKYAKSKKEFVGKTLSNTSTSMSFAFAKSIKKKGIDPTFFLTDAIKSLEQRLASSKIINSYRLDVTESIQNFNK